MTGFRLLSYVEENGSSRAGLLVQDRVFDLEAVLEAVGRRPGFQGNSVLSTLEAWDLARPEIDHIVEAIFARSVPVLEALGRPLERVKLLAPVLYPGVLYCAGANYRDHLIEMTGKEPAANYRKPFFFLKTVKGSIIGPEQEIRLPTYSSKVDWEAEIALVMGRAARDVPAEQAMEYVAGYTIMNDLSARDLTKRDDVPFVFDWIGQKCFDTSAPMGPWITPTDAIINTDRMAIKLWVNDELKQDSHSGQLIFNFQELVAYLSCHITLNPGDIIATGTPAGCGMARGEFLKPGDQIRITVSGLGELCNPVVAG
jgi:2-keto-4-pentenoate hydratase/2-oxohepta-3-ene-1,7-dioic acid hydratase in catechol pathway